MATLRILREEVTNVVTLRLEGTLDGAAALMLKQALQEVTAPAFAVDFSRVREFQDLAVAVLSPALHNRDCELRGLDTHHQRMFRYFGVGPGRSFIRAEDALNA
jgi:2'-5' RNA ligase